MIDSDEEFIERMEAAIGGSTLSPATFSKITGCTINEACQLFAYMAPCSMIRLGYIDRDGNLMGPGGGKEHS